MSGRSRASAWEMALTGVASPQGEVILSTVHQCDVSGQGSHLSRDKVRTCLGTRFYLLRPAVVAAAGVQGERPDELPVFFEDLYVRLVNEEHHGCPVVASADPDVRELAAIGQRHLLGLVDDVASDGHRDSPSS